VIEEALEASKCVVVVWTDASVKSNWVKTEAGEGERQKKLIPILLDCVEIPLAFRRIEAAQLYDWDGVSLDHSEVAILSETVRGLVNKRSRVDDRPPNLIPQSKNVQNKQKWMAGVIIGFIIIMLIGLGFFGQLNHLSSEDNFLTDNNDLNSGSGEVLVFDNCFSDFFGPVNEGRVYSVEEGLIDLVIIRANQTKRETFGIHLTENGEAIGALKVDFHSSGNIFKIVEIVDSICSSVEFSNETDPGEIVLQNWDTIEFQLHDLKYVLRLGFDSGEITVGQFTKIVK